MSFTLALTLLSSREDVTLWAFVGACAGVYLFYRGFQLLQRRRLILNIPASKVRSASLGLVEVSGLAMGPYTIPAPITSLPCYYYHTQAWEQRHSGKNKEWKKVADESLHVPFYLDDNTGRVLVDPRGAEMDLHRDFHEEFGSSLFSTSLSIPNNVSGFLARHGVSGERPVRVDEYCIKPKNALFILGTLAENPGLAVSPIPVASTGSQHPFSIQLPGTVSQRLASAMQVPGINVSWGATQTEFGSASPDRPQPSAAPAVAQAKIAEAMTKAGITNPAAWAAAGLQYPGVSVDVQGSGNAAAAAPAALPAEEFDLNPKTVLMKGQNNPAFFISWRSQREVAQSLAWRSTLMIWGGPALTLLCLYVLAAKFGWL
jgi:hypothetical protein